jgi:hypothetical protein
MDFNAQRIRYWVLAAVLVVAIGVSIKLFIQPAVAPENIIEVGHFSLVVDYGDNNSDSYGNISFNAGETLFSATQKLTMANGIEFDYENYGDMGMLVTNIGGKSSGESGAYWQYWVNENYSQVGASIYTIQDGDRIEWKFTDAQQ